MTAMPPAFNLAASGGGGESVGGEMMAGAPGGPIAGFTPFSGLIKEAGAKFLKQPRPGSTASDYHTPDFELSERVDVLAKYPGNWYKVSRFHHGVTVEGYVDAAKVNPMPGHIGGSTRRPGMNNAGTAVADDLKAGDYTRAQIDALGTLMSISASAPEWSLWADLRLMSHGLFASGDLSTNIGMMIDKFQANTGGVYQSDILNNAVRNHPSQERFRLDAQAAFDEKIKSVGGDANRLPNDQLKQLTRPIFNNNADIWRGGLTIAINDVWAYDVDLTSYDREGDNYAATLKLTLHDHFGLDQPDVEKKYYYLAGFRAWFILQHLYGYKPFQVQIPLSYTFHGKLR